MKGESTLKGKLLINRGKIAPYLFISPFFIMFAVFWLRPIISGFLLSFTEWRGFGIAKFVGLANYQKLFSDSRFLIAVKNTLFFLAVYDSLLIILAFVLAILLNSPRLRFKGFIRSSLFAPMTMSLVVVAMVFDLIYHKDFGLLNSILKTFHLPHRFNWLYDERLTMWSIIMCRLWRAVGYYAAILLSGLQTIPTDLYEAADIDGASTLDKVIHITLPLMKPVLLFGIIMSSIWAFQLFEEPWLLVGGGPNDATLTMVIYLYQVGFRFMNLGYSAAIAFVLTLMILVFSGINMALFKER